MGRAVYEYKSKVVRVVDGDTIDLDVDLGFYLTSRIRVRLLDVNTPELRGESREAAQDAKRLVEEWCPVGSTVQVETTKTGKYGRWLAQVTLPDGLGNLNQLLRDRGW
jgi:micrococcal nuclease